jgi:hypothetical protein
VGCCRRGGFIALCVCTLTPSYIHNSELHNSSTNRHSREFREYRKVRMAFPRPKPTTVSLDRAGGAALMIQMETMAMVRIYPDPILCASVPSPGDRVVSQRSASCRSRTKAHVSSDF